MRKLGILEIKNAQNTLEKECRLLEAARLSFLFLGGSKEAVISELRSFQNADGGLGKALEPDFRLPSSSAIATSFALDIFVEVGMDSGHDLVIEAVRYLEDTFDPSQGTWYIVPKEVDAYPRAAWWNYDGWVNEDSTVAYPGNPGAELLGYLWHFKIEPDTFDLEEATERMIKRLLNFKGHMEVHELYSYLRMYEFLSSYYQDRMREILVRQSLDLVNKDPSKWDTYVPQPVNFVKDRNFFLYPPLADVTEMNLDYIIETMRSDGTWEPTWHWGRFPEEWEKAKLEWKGVETVKKMKIMRAFDRLDI